MSGARRQIDVGEAMKRVVELIAESLDGLLDELPAAATTACAAFGEPIEILARRETRRIPVRRVEKGELLDDVARPTRDVGVVRTREPASTRNQILENHHVALTVGLREPHTGHADGDLARQVAIEPCFCDAHAGLVDERPLLLVEGRELDEHVPGHFGGAPQFQACPSGGSGAAIDQDCVGYVAVECAREPLRVEFFNLLGQFYRRAHYAGVNRHHRARTTHTSVFGRRPWMCRGTCTACRWASRTARTCRP